MDLFLISIADQLFEPSIVLMIEQDDEQLVRLTLKGDKNAFADLVERYQKPMFNVAFRICGNREDASDVTQASFLKAYEQLKQFDSRFKFYSWLYRITVNGSLNFINSKRRFEELSDEMVSSEQSPDNQYSENDTSRAIQDALMKLTPEYRIVVVLSHFHEFSYKQMSDVLDIPEKTIKSRLFSARQNLRQILLKKGL